jgi:IPT/TIG domain/NHL repeat
MVRHLIFFNWQQKTFLIMKKSFLIFLFLVSAFLYTCKQIQNDLGPNAIITDVTLSLNTISGSALDTFSITGTGFSNSSIINLGLVTISLNGIPITIITATQTEIQGTFPASDTAYTGTLQITIAGVSTSYPYNLGISSQTITRGSNGSLILTINGSGFVSSISGNSINLNGTDFTITSATSTQIIAQSPPNMSASLVQGVYTVSTQGLNAQSLKYGSHFFADTIYPNTGSAGTVVKIHGAGFGTNKSAVSVSFNGTPAVVQAIVDTLITTAAPQGGTTGPVAVTIGPNTFAYPVFTYLTGAFSIGSIVPNSGLAGSTVLINGSGFSTQMTNDKVTFAGGTATITNATATQLTVTVPSTAITGAVTVSINGATLTGPVFTILQQVSTFAGSGTAGSADGNGSSASFKNPENGAFDNLGNLYVADYGNNEIRKVDASGNVTTFAGSTSSGFTDGKGTAARFYAPSGLCFDNQGNLYVSDEENGAIRKIDPSGNVTTIAGNGTLNYADGIGKAATFNRPIGIAFDALSNSLYVADSRNNMIRQINLATDAVTTFAGSIGYGSVDGYAGQPTTATFSSPRGIGIFSAGTATNEQLYIVVADYTNNKIREIQSIGGYTSVVTLGGNSNNASGFIAGVPSSFSGPNSISMNTGGNSGYYAFFIADASNHAIRFTAQSANGINANQLYAQILTGNGNAGLINGTLAQAEFDFPDGVVYNPVDGNLYVIEFGNNDIRKIILTH